MNRILFLFLCISMGYSEPFYVHPLTGSDTHSGRSPGEAWKTTDAVRDHAWSPGFLPGDTIFFAAGHTISGSKGLYIQLDRSQGSATNPVVFTSDGSGRATIEATATDGMLIWAPANAQHMGIIIENIDFKGDGNYNEQENKTQSSQ